MNSDLLKYGRILSLIHEALQNCSVALYMTYKCIHVTLLSFIFLGMCWYMRGQERKLLMNESIVRYVGTYSRLMVMLCGYMKVSLGIRVTYARLMVRHMWTYARLLVRHVWTYARIMVRHVWHSGINAVSS